MKIAQISPYDFAYYGGVQRHITSLSNELSLMGHDVVILSPCSNKSPKISFDQLDFRSLGSSIPIPFAGSIARISPSLLVKRKLINIFEEEKFDVIHVHEPFVPLISILSTNISQVPVVGTFHSYNENKSLFYALGKFFLKNTYEKLSAKITVSEPSKIFMKNFFPGDYHVIPNGIDIKKFSKKHPYPSEYDKDSYNLLFVGRVNESRKGLSWLIKAFSILRLQRSDIKLIIVGQGNPDPEIYRIIGERGLQGIIFTGEVSDENLIAYYQHADIFCAPNTGNESFGIIIVDAMAASTAVVASDISGFRSVMKNNEHGIFVKPRDEINLAKSILKLINNPDIRQKFGLNGLSTSYKYSWDNISERIINIYEKVI